MNNFATDLRNITEKTYTDSKWNEISEIKNKLRDVAKTGDCTYVCFELSQTQKGYLYSEGVRVEYKLGKKEGTGEEVWLYIITW